MNKNSKKVPAALIIIVVVIIAVAVFVPTVYMPYQNKKPLMDEEHQAAVDQLAVYDDAIANQAAIEKDLEELQAEWDKFQKDMFVDARSSLDDIQTKVDELGINLVKFNRGSETADPEGAYSFTGSPLYYVTIDLEFYTDRDTLLEFLKYIEEDSVGCYYVKTFNATTQKEDKDMDKFVVKEGELEVNMQVYLYYYNQDITIDPALLEGEEGVVDGEAAAE